MQKPHFEMSVGKLYVLAGSLLANLAVCHGTSRLSTQLNARLVEHCGGTLTVGACSGSTRTVNYAGTAVFKVPGGSCTVDLITPPECNDENLGIYINIRKLYLPKADTLAIRQISGSSNRVLKSLTGQAESGQFYPSQSSVAQLLVHNVTNSKLSIEYLRSAHSYMSSHEAILEVTVLRMEKEANFQRCPALNGYIPRNFCDKSGFLHCPSEYAPSSAGLNPARALGSCERDGPNRPTDSSTRSTTSVFLALAGLSVRVFLQGN